MKKFKSKADKFAFIVRRVVPILVPIAFLFIALSEGKLYWIAGIMVILVIFAYALQKFNIGNPIDNK